MNKRVVVTGIGVIAPNGHGLEEFSAALKSGQSGIRFLPRLTELGFSCQVGGIPQNIQQKAGAYFSEESMLAMSEVMLLAGIAAVDAWKDAGLSVPDSDSQTVHWDTGCVVGAGIGGMEVIAEKLVPMVSAGKTRRMGSTMVEQVMASSVSAKLSGIFALGNQVTSNSSACNTGTEAIVDAYNRIKFGLAERMLAGGAEGAAPQIWAGFDAMKVLCSDFNHEPHRASRPMSASAAGFIPGSGSGILLLESLESALNRNARVYAEILGGSINCGGHRMGGSMTAPNATSVQNCIRDAVTMANIRPGEIDLINGHLTATFADPMEVENWSKALALSDDEFPFIQSTKSMIGHCLGAAGSLESAATVLQLDQGFIHPSINSEDVHQRISGFQKRIPQTVVKKDIQIAAKASFGFGDVNGCIIFKKWNGEN